MGLLLVDGGMEAQAAKVRKREFLSSKEVKSNGEREKGLIGCSYMAFIIILFLFN